MDDTKTTRNLEDLHTIFQQHIVIIGDLFRVPTQDCIAEVLLLPLPPFPFSSSKVLI